MMLCSSSRTIISHNIKLIKDHLDQHHPGYNFVVPVAAANGDEMVFVRELGFLSSISICDEFTYKRSSGNTGPGV